MTDITIIKIATPSIIPTKEKIEIIFKNPSFLLGLRFLDENPWKRLKIFVSTGDFTLGKPLLQFEKKQLLILINIEFSEII